MGFRTSMYLLNSKFIVFCSTFWLPLLPSPTSPNPISNLKLSVSHTHPIIIHSLCIDRCRSKQITPLRWVALQSPALQTNIFTNQLSIAKWKRFSVLEFIERQQGVLASQTHSFRTQFAFDPGTTLFWFGGRQMKMHDVAGDGQILYLSRIWMNAQAACSCGHEWFVCVVRIANDIARPFLLWRCKTNRLLVSPPVLLLWYIVKLIWC